MDRISRPGQPLSRRWALRQAGGGLIALAGAGRVGAVGAAAPATPPAEASFPPADQEALAATLQQAVAMGLVPGAVVGIWIPGRGSFVAAAGLGDVAAGAPMTTGDAFRVGSITKTFTATAVLQLVDEGKFGLDDPVGRYVPGVPNGDQATVRQVLAMTAGIPNYTEDPAFVAAVTADPLMAFTPQDALAIALRYPPDFAPGAETRYSDTNYIVLGLLIERASGQPAPDVIARLILTPLGLTHTTFPTTPEMPDPFAHGYLLTAEGAPPRDVTRSNPDLAGTAGAMISDLEDLRVWAKALANGALLQPATQRARLAWTTLPGASGVEIRYGLGIAEIAGFIGHTGATFGYSTFMGYLPDEDATAVVLTNNGSISEATAPGLFAFLAQPLFPDRIPAGAGAPVPGTPPA
jgi:D-alanyl-D-alanine carboxypeptidase